MLLKLALVQVEFVRLELLAELVPLELARLMKLVPIAVIKGFASLLMVGLNIVVT